MEEEGAEGHRLPRPRSRPGARQRMPERLTPEKLRQMNNDDPSTILLLLSKPSSGLQELLKQEDHSVDTVKLMISVLGKACLCESMSTSLNSMLTSVHQTPFFTSTLVRFFTQINMNRGGDNGVVKSILPLLTEILRRMPTQGWQSVQVVAVMVQNLWHKGGMGDEDLNKAMLAVTDLLVRSQPPPPQVMSANDIPRHNQDPPESFRELPIIPRKGELNGTIEVFVLPSIIEGPFRDVEHYLECQFRLFRADVILPLKENIVSFQTVAENTSIGYRVYSDVQIVRPVCTHNGLCYRLAFDTTPLKHVRWDSTRRLIFGSLVCLSSDNFVDSMLFATVDQRQKEDLKNGLVDVQFLADHDTIANISRDTRFSMVESSAYFEAYKDILRGMQVLNDRNFPFQKYIVECETNVEEPRYLRQQPDVLYDLRPLLDDAYQITGDQEVSDQQFPDGSDIANRVKIQDITTWPIPEYLNLDPSQHEALRNALTREFTLIQGPPGTGKTYVGIKILKALLCNSSIWLQDQESLPIVVVCYTNHALDQFLEGILSFFKGKLIRVGSRSKNEAMQEYSLMNARQRVREMRAMPVAVHSVKMTTRREMESAKVDIHTVAAKIEVAEREIVHENILKPFMNEASVKGFPKEDEFGNRMCHIISWLGVQKRLFQIERKGEVYLRHRLEELDIGDELEEDLEPEETIDLVENPRAQRQLLEDIVDFDDEELSDVFDRVQNLDTDVRTVRREAIGFDITNLGKEQPFRSLPKDLKDEQRREKRRLKYYLIKNIRSTDRMTEQESFRVRNIWNLSYAHRWRLYRYWVDLLCKQAKGEIRDKEQNYSRLAATYKETCLQEDKVILQNSSVIGMTTTAAARYQNILNEIGPKIVVVEEAAEVLEAHVIGTLSRHCQHLILIGDHKQLRPNPTVHDLAKKFNLEVSLFERMVKNGLHCNTLLWQHRMRPEIAEVIRPIYPKLKNHDVVMNYDHVKGINNDVFFINHNQPHEHDEETKSFYNDYEVKYLVELCRYLKKQGYSTSQITILTTYSAQMHCFKDSMPNSEFNGVRVTSVDSYQGEENDLVLLSLVRSEDEGGIGFLKEENRICVALSRAKMGLYVIGNFTHITDHSSLMKDICTTAAQKGILGSLKLTCQSHPSEDGIVVSNPSDFRRSPEGGCTKPCEYRLTCGHVCPRMCHVSPSGHTEVLCNKPCKKKCQQCQNFHCSHACYKPCEPCPVLVEKKLPRCGHIQEIPGGEDERTYQCQKACPDTLSCGHKCSGKCGQRHPSCKEMVDVRQPCGHTVNIECALREILPCTKACDTELACGHKCQGTCGTCHNGRLHQPCNEKCKRILICGHECQSSCGNCPPCTRPCENRCIHSKCGKKCGEPCVSCKEECQWKCRHVACKTPCGDTCDKQRCSSPCRKKLACGHNCIGVCGEPCPDRCRICHKEEVTTVFLGREDEENALFIQLEDCTHIFEMNDLDQYMEGPSNDGHEDEEGSSDKVVKIKVCPRCTTPIRKNLRYGNIIKLALSDIEKVKEKVNGCQSRIASIRASIDKMKHRMFDDHKAVVQELLSSTPVPSEIILSTQENQVRIFQQILGLERRVKESTGRIKVRDVMVYEPLSRDLRNFKQWTMLARPCFTKQDIDDAMREMERLSLLKYLIDANEWIDLEKTSVQPRIMRDLAAIIREMEQPFLMNDERLDEARKMKEEVKEFVPGSGFGVSDQERLMIVEAMGLNKGHWFKCRKGHVYAIGECGRAAEQSSCPECGGAIGGQSHRLEDDNAWAPEMDDAEEPVWSEDRDFLLALQLQFGGH